MLGTAIAEEENTCVFLSVWIWDMMNIHVVLVPSWRQDLESYADLAEEVARFYGYDKIPTSLPSGEATTGRLSEKLKVEKIVRNVSTILWIFHRV